MDQKRELTHNGEGYWFTEEQWLLKQNLRELVEAEIAPRFEENFEEESATKLYYESMAKLGEGGYLRAYIPEALGGLGMGAVGLGIVAEEVARGNGAVAIHALENQVLGIMMSNADPNLWEAIMDGKIILGFSGCAPEGQMNTPEQADIATFDEATNEWVLNGEKAFCSGGTFCNFLVVTGMYNGDQYVWILGDPKNVPGLTVHSHPEIGCSPTSASLTMKDIRLPAFLGFPRNSCKDNYPIYTNDPMTVVFPLGVACMAIGSAEAALEKAISYLTNRTTNFKPIASLGQIQGKIVAMKEKLEAARCLTYTALHMVDTNYKDGVLYAHLAKSFTCNTARWITGECLQMFGNVGANPHAGVAQHMLDTIVYSIGTGTSDMHVNGAAMMMGLPKSDNILKPAF